MLKEHLKRILIPVFGLKRVTEVSIKLLKIDESIEHSPTASKTNLGYIKVSENRKSLERKVEREFIDTVVRRGEDIS